MNSLCSKDIKNRLASIEGHIKGVRQMVEEDKPCEEVLLQLSAIESAVNKAGKLLLKAHLEHCVKEGVERGDYQVLERFSKILDKFV
ncbi:MAG: hypothetical protein EOM87_02515 [Clostridia bacterium]|nr:hypothetical protein [Clostridia bacterium]